MAAKRYAVLNAVGVVVNHIFINDPLPAKYWPGYGAALVPLEDCDASAGAALDVYVLKIVTVPGIGDTLDVNTGSITRFVPVIKQEMDDKGELIDVASAPEQQFIAEVDPQTEKQVFDKPLVETKEGK
jgi:hypothetical protein